MSVKKVAKKKTLPKISYELICEYFGSEKECLDRLMDELDYQVTTSKKKLNTNSLELLYNSLESEDIATIILEYGNTDGKLSEILSGEISKLLLPAQKIIITKATEYCNRLLSKNLDQELILEPFYYELGCYSIVAILEYDFDDFDNHIISSISEYKKLLGAEKAAQYQKNLKQVIKKVVTYDIFKKWVIDFILYNRRRQINEFTIQKNNPTKTSKETKEQILARIKELEKQIQNAC